tara:strand:+ start:15292 stop:16998 length:1707 start_codon:yes stop_codon:yes gene_type:complete
MASRLNTSKLLPSQSTVTASSVRESLVEVETQNNRQQVEVYTFLGKQLTSINRNVESIGRNLETLTRAISGETRAELSQADASKRERLRDAERTAFGRSENILESRLTAAITKPINAVKGAVSSKLFDLKKALLFLFGGWLTTKFLRMLQADANGNKSEFEKLKGELVTALAAAGAAFLVLNGGLIGLITTIGGLTFRLGKFLLLKPFTSLFNALRPKPPVVTPKPPAVAPKPGATTVPGATPKPGKPGATTVPGATRPGVAPGRPPGSGGTILGPTGKPTGPQMQGTTPGRAPSIPSPKPTPPKVVTPKNPLAFFSKPRGVLRGLKSLLGNARFLGALGGVLKGAFVVSKIKSRLDQGMSPTQAVVPVIPEMLLTLKGATLGGGLAGLLGLTTGPGALLVGAAGAIGGGFIGQQIGQVVTGGLDSLYDPLGMDNLFGFANDPITNFLQGLGLMKKPEEGGFTPGVGAKGRGTGVAAPPTAAAVPHLHQENVKVPSTDKQTSNRLMSAGPDFDDEKDNEMPQDVRDAIQTLEQKYPLTSGNEIPNQLTYDTLNPYRSLATSIYNINYQ